MVVVVTVSASPVTVAATPMYSRPKADSTSNVPPSIIHPLLMFKTPFESNEALNPTDGSFIASSKSCIDVVVPTVIVLVTPELF